MNRQISISEVGNSLVIIANESKPIVVPRGQGVCGDIGNPYGFGISLLTACERLVECIRMSGLETLVSRPEPIEHVGPSCEQ